MKTINFTIAVILLLFSGAGISAQQKVAVNGNDFLVKAFNSRMIATNEAKMAVTKGSTVTIRNFAKEMIKEQNTLYTDIKKLSAQRNLLFPKSVNYIDTRERTNLSKLKGKSFDSKYISLTTSDLEKEIARFKEAANATDNQISLFAGKQVSLLESQLNKLNQLK